MGWDDWQDVIKRQIFFQKKMKGMNIMCDQDSMHRDSTGIPPKKGWAETQHNSKVEVESRPKTTSPHTQNAEGLPCQELG